LWCVIRTLDWGRITQDIYDKKLKEYKEKQYDLGIQLEEHTKADEDYHITASTIFNLANRALTIFESSEPQEKRQFLNYLLQNCRLSGKKLYFDLRSPFNLILETANQPVGLRTVHNVRTRIEEAGEYIYIPDLHTQGQI